MIEFSSDQWVIVALVFILGILIGAFLLAGSGRKWKARYRDEKVARDKQAAELKERQAEWEKRESEWRERDSLRAAAIRDRRADDRPL